MKGGLARQRFSERQRRNRIVGQLNELHAAGYNANQIRAAGNNAYRTLTQAARAPASTTPSAPQVQPVQQPAPIYTYQQPAMPTVPQQVQALQPSYAIQEPMDFADAMSGNPYKATNWAKRRHLPAWLNAPVGIADQVWRIGDWIKNW